MNQELMNQALNLFDTPEKWNAFLELYSQRDEMRNQWYGKLRELSIKRFNTIDVVDGWSFKPSNSIDMCWYLTEYGDQSIRIVFGWCAEMTLFYDGVNFSKMNDLMKNKRFSPILEGFQKLDGVFQGNRIAYESRNFIFESPYDTKFDCDRLAWFAGNQTESFVDQIVKKVNRFRKDDNLTVLLGELNKEVRVVSA